MTGLGFIAGVVLLSCACFAQEQAAAKKPVSVALYRLALDEWVRCKAGGVRLPRRRPVVAGALLALPGDGDRDGSRFSEEWAKVVDATVLPRALFEQAAAAPVAVFPLAEMEQVALVDTGLFELCELTFAHAWGAAERGPIASVRDVIALLRHARHIACGGASEHLRRSFAIERDVARPLRIALGHITDPGAHARQLDRLAEELDRHVRATFEVEQIKAALGAEIGPLMKVHYSRLRDMHQKLPSGYDEKGMRRRIRAALDGVFDKCQDVEKEPIAWMRRISGQISELATPANKGGSIPEKAARGMAYLVLCSVDPVLREQAESRAELLECRAQLAELRR